MVYETRSAQETFALGERIGREAKPGEIYTLTGDLGVGKTVLTQGVASGLGIVGTVNSPTFTILQVYENGRLPFYHFDVYRIGDEEEMEEIGYEDCFFWRRCLPDRVGGTDFGDITGNENFYFNRKRSCVWTGLSKNNNK